MVDTFNVSRVYASSSHALQALIGLSPVMAQNLLKTNSFTQGTRIMVVENILLHAPPFSITAIVLYQL
jgi:hypothetical protein